MKKEQSFQARITYKENLTNVALRGLLSPPQLRRRCSAYRDNQALFIHSRSLISPKEIILYNVNTRCSSLVDATLSSR